MQKTKTDSVIDNVRVYFKTNQHHNAQKLLSLALESDPASTDLRFWLGKTYCMQNKFAEAVGEFNTVLETDPVHAEALICLVAVYCDLGRYQDGEEIYQRLRVDPSTRLDPLACRKLRDCHVACGDLYRQLGRKADAVQEYQKAVLVEKDVQARLRLALTMHYPEQAEQALIEIAEILAVAPEFYEAFLWSGLCFWRLGDYERATEQWERARRLRPTDAKVLALLKAGM